MSLNIKIIGRELYVLAIDVYSISKKDIASSAAEERGFDIGILAQFPQSSPGNY